MRELGNILECGKNNATYVLGANRIGMVPAWVCGQCGEAYFEEKEVDAVQDLIKLIDQKAEELVMTA